MAAENRFINADNIPDRQDVLRTLQASEMSLTQQIDMFKGEPEKISKNRKELKKKIKRDAEEIKNRVEKLKQNSIRKVDELYAPAEKFAIQNKLDLKSKRSSTKDMVSSVNNVSEASVSLTEGQNLALEGQNLASKARQHATSLQMVDFEFVNDQKLSTLLKDMTSLGKVTQRNMKNRPTSENKKLQRNSSTQKYNIKFSDRVKCYIISACVLGDGTIVLADHNNRKLKRVDSNTYTFTDSCDLPVRPCQVCALREEVAVSCFEAGVQFVSLLPNMTITREIKLGHTCRGLAYAGGNLYISDLNSVYKYSIVGTKLHQFTTNQQGKQLFKTIYGIAVSGDGGKIYVADGENGLIALDANMPGIFYPPDPKLKNAEDVLVTHNGSVLVCGYDTKNVVQFGPNCEMIGEVLKYRDEGKGCTSICYNPNSSKLIVGRFETDEIEEYDLI